MQASEIWRNNKQWSKYLGKKGKVLAVTTMEVSATDQLDFLPYAYLLVDLGDEKISLMGAAAETFAINDQVELVLLRLRKELSAEVISYGLKAKKTSPLT